MMRSPVMRGRVAGSALTSQTQIRERNHTDVTFEMFAISQNGRMRGK
jgi:hypothetical protein